MRGAQYCWPEVAFLVASGLMSITVASDSNPLVFLCAMVECRSVMGSILAVRAVRNARPRKYYFGVLTLTFTSA